MFLFVAEEITIKKKNGSREGGIGLQLDYDSNSIQLSVSFKEPHAGAIQHSLIVDKPNTLAHMLKAPRLATEHNQTVRIRLPSAGSLAQKDARNPAKVSVCRAHESQQAVKTKRDRLPVSHHHAQRLFSRLRIDCHPEKDSADGDPPAQDSANVFVLRHQHNTDLAYGSPAQEEPAYRIHMVTGLLCAAQDQDGAT